MSEARNVLKAFFKDYRDKLPLSEFEMRHFNMGEKFDRNVETCNRLYKYLTGDCRPELEYGQSFTKKFSDGSEFRVGIHELFIIEFDEVELTQLGTDEI